MRAVQATKRSSPVRAFRRDDVDSVARLWSQAFGRRRGVSAETVRRYFDDVFFHNPWHAIGLPSLVHEDKEGRIVGFLGVIPRWMRFMGQMITVAIASQLMVDHSRPTAFVAFEMLRTLFAGPQDLTFSDGANDIAQQLWVAAGGSVAMLYSSTWTRVLQPSGYVAGQCIERGLLPRAARLSRPFCVALDCLASKARRSPYWLPPPQDVEDELSDEQLLSCIERFSKSRALRPEYDAESLQWLLRHSSEQRTHGELKRALIRSSNGQVLGWYLFYVRPGGISQLLQIGGRSVTIHRVLSHLFHHARREGAVAVAGQLEPEFARVLTQQHCTFTWIGGALMHSRNAQLLNAIHRGDAFLSRLEGEWWMRFCDLRESH